ncbi:MAG: hypothetical protein FWH55_12870 [Oscillospiraceae bacterium]|nr:hypothetical protein [Oscillospiraceae bacterium]
MTSKQRLERVLAHRIPDRTPISMYEMVQYNYWENTDDVLSYDVIGADYKGWYCKQPSYVALIEYLRKNADCLYMWFPEEISGSGKFLNGYDFTSRTQTQRTGDSVITQVTIETPRGDLSVTTRVDKGLNTVWETEHLLKDINDVDKLLSLPYEPYRPDLSSYSAIEEKLGEDGIMMPNLGDPVLYVAELFGFTEFSLLAYTEKKRIKYLLDVMYERVLDNLQYQLLGGVKGLYRIVGPEYVTAPFLPVDYFNEFVAPYDKKLVEMLHKYGALARLHCHGRVGGLLEIFRDMGVDAIDPVEDYPSGDVSLAEAKRRIGAEVTLFGNIQLRDIELLSQVEMVELTRRTLDAAMGNGGFVIMPTSGPITSELSPATEKNCYAFVDTVLKYGVY